MPSATFTLLKVAVPPERLTTSPTTAPTRARPVTVAESFPSYTLLLAVNVPVMCLAVISKFFESPLPEWFASPAYV